MTQHLRNGVELPEVNRDNHYSTHFQEIRSLNEPRKILPVSQRESSQSRPGAIKDLCKTAEIK
jgi:hypothetical protein